VRQTQKTAFADAFLSFRHLQRKRSLLVIHRLASKGKRVSGTIPELPNYLADEIRSYLQEQNLLGTGRFTAVRPLGRPHRHFLLSLTPFFRKKFERVTTLRQSSRPDAAIKANRASRTRTSI
jgi:hypothetical protein